MQDLLLWAAIGFVGNVLFCSFFEWTLHRYVMHQAVGKFDYAFKAHAVVHHQIFKADHTYHLVHEKDKHTIPMAWWNGPILILLCQLPFALIALFNGKWGIMAGSFIASCAYYGAYEYMHWCMHLPKKRNIERSGIYFRLNGHHLLHHRYMHKNFNVVLPLADLCLGTLLLRSKVNFAQARGPAVPDVQPKERRREPVSV
ncbi:MAG TPA: fatty acid hydroxylase [Verrucomicrobiae bacterium]|nr:fatty acid hydroxylase [Verrucomicrobiae bacterium]